MYSYDHKFLKIYKFVLYTMFSEMEVGLYESKFKWGQYINIVLEWFYFHTI